MAAINQTKLSKLPKKCTTPLKKPSFLLNWEKSRPKFKKFLLLHLIRAADEYRSPHSRLTTERLVNDLSTNMGGIVEAQVKLYVENLIYHGYIAESYLGEVITLTDKAYDDLGAIDRILSEKNLSKNNNSWRKGR